MYTFETKFNIEKIEGIMKNNRVNIESHVGGSYRAYVTVYDRRVYLDITMSKLSITITCNYVHSYWGNIRSYKKFEEVLKGYIKEIKKKGI